MRDRLSIGCTPSDEQCFPVGHELAFKECMVYKHQLQREFPGLEFQVTRNSHDFGTYYEVAVCYDTEDESSVAFEAESGLATWDAVARKEIKALKLENSLGYQGDYIQLQVV